MRSWILALGLVAALGGCGKGSEEAKPPRDELLYAEGASLFNRYCVSCHDATGRANKIGPYLAGLAGRKAGTASGFAYSSAMREADIRWTAETLDSYLAAPDLVVPGTSMIVDLLTDPAERKAIIHYLLAN